MHDRRWLRSVIILNMHFIVPQNCTERWESFRLAKGIDALLHARKTVAVFQCRVTKPTIIRI